MTDVFFLVFLSAEEGEEVDCLFFLFACRLLTLDVELLPEELVLPELLELQLDVELLLR
jgi:hypothetical protein